jgi:hypothetical protein
LNQALKFTVAKYYTPSGRCIQSTEYRDNGSARKEGAAVFSPISLSDVTGQTNSNVETNVGPTEPDLSDAFDGEDGADDDGTEVSPRDSNGKGYSARTYRKSERKTFRTKSGRMVRDGEGIAADVKVPSQELSLVEALCIRNNAFFDFASQWTKVCTRHLNRRYFHRPIFKTLI